MCLCPALTLRELLTSDTERACTLLQVPVRSLVINQVVDQAATDRFLAMRRKDQQRALELLRSLPALK